mmetsp:Transcript_14117/g.38691  ORF Transcript_14117/g.38691 Transcript_14117/m.38691 type:complete len:232 (+) Transcript_14117:228-923(+)
MQIFSGSLKLSLHSHEFNRRSLRGLQSNAGRLLGFFELCSLGATCHSSRIFFVPSRNIRCLSEFYCVFVPRCLLGRPCRNPRGQVLGVRLQASFEFDHHQLFSLVSQNGRLGRRDGKRSLQFLVEADPPNQRLQFGDVFGVVRPHECTVPYDRNAVPKQHELEFQRNLACALLFRRPHNCGLAFLARGNCSVKRLGSGFGCGPCISVQRLQCRGNFAFLAHLGLVSLMISL